MKFFLTFCLSLLFTLMANAQTPYIAGGANFSFINNGSLDYVIKSYNEQRMGKLTKQMDDFGFMHGATVNAGLIGQTGLTLEIAWVGRHVKHSAESVDSTRDLKLRNNSFNMGFGYSLANESVFCPGLLMSFDFGSFKSFTRVGPSDDIGDIDYDRMQKETQLGITFTLNLMITGKEKPIGFAVRPYYQFQVFNVDFQELNYILNPHSAQADLALDLSESLGNFGVQAVLVLMFREN